MLRLTLPVLLAALCCAGAARGQDPVEVARRILGGEAGPRDGGYQLELPAGGAAEAEGGGGLRPRRGPRPGRGGLEGSGGLGPVLWVLLGLGLAVFAVALVRNSLRAGRDLRLADPPRPSDPAAAGPDEFDPGEQPLAEAERLAAQGRYTDAIRALLGRTFDALRARGGFPVAAWMTSRTILRRAPLRAAARARLGELVDAVELSLFARRAPGAAEYAACVAAFRALAAEREVRR